MTQWEESKIVVVSWLKVGWSQSPTLILNRNQIEFSFFKV